MRSALCVGLAMVSWSASASATGTEGQVFTLAIAQCDPTMARSFRSVSEERLGALLLPEGASREDASVVSVLCIGAVLELRIVRRMDERLFASVLDLRRTPARSRGRVFATALEGLLRNVVTTQPREETRAPTPTIVTETPPSTPVPALVPQQSVPVVAPSYAFGVDLGTRFVFQPARSLWGGGLRFEPRSGIFSWYTALRFEFGIEPGVLFGTYAQGGVRALVEQGNIAFRFSVGVRAGWLGFLDRADSTNGFLLSPIIEGDFLARAHPRLRLRAGLSQGVDLSFANGFSAAPWFGAALGMELTIP